MNARKVMTMLVALGIAAGTSGAQVLTVLHTFSPGSNDVVLPTKNADGAEPMSDLVLCGNTLYGTASMGGSNGVGTVFSIETDGSDFTVLHTFGGTNDGGRPGKHLALANGTLYGIFGVISGLETATNGGVFSVETNGSNYTVIYKFNTNTNGTIGDSNGGLVFCGGTLYGTAFKGGTNDGGSIFSVDTNGNFQLLHLFGPGFGEGANPEGTLVLSRGILYGTTLSNGLADRGTIFSINTNGSNFTVLHAFGGIPDGARPMAGMTLSGNTLYGTTSEGGSSTNEGTVFSINTDGSGYTKLHFSAGPGAKPEAPLWLHGNTLYGTSLGDMNALVPGAEGAVFFVETNGSNYNVLKTFPGGNEFGSPTNAIGEDLTGSLAMAGNVLYGAASDGGEYGNGTIFSIAIQAVISSIDLEGDNVTLNAANGFTGDTWLALASADLTAPPVEWTPMATNTLSADGDFSLIATNGFDATVPQQFYILQQQ